jgi:hypothetical protein
MTQRFSRQALADHLQERINAIEDVWGFDPANGYNQVSFVAADCFHHDSRDLFAGLDQSLVAFERAALMAYGEWCALVRTAEEFDLEVFAVHAGLYPKNLAPPAPSSLIRYRAV